MTKQEVDALLKEYGAENVISLVFDNDLNVDFLGDTTFSADCVKTVAGVDVIELTCMKFRSKSTGRYDIDCITVHPVDCLQCILFSPKDKRDDIDTETFHSIR